MPCKPIWFAPALAWVVAAAMTLAVVPVSEVKAAGGTARKAAPAANWDPRAAAHYLDSRERWWQGWDRAQKDHGTLCISCHTQATYGLARPILRPRLGEQTLAAEEETMLASIRKRVSIWRDAEPFYPDAKYGAGKEIESRNAESVLNAVILSSYDRRAGQLSATTRQAFANAWALQSTSGPTAGAWVWQNFHYAPWESPESEYHGAALMAMAVGKAPERYRDEVSIAANVAALRAYLRSHYEKQPLLNKVMALWASRWSPDLLTKEQRSALLGLLYTLQRPDGGWSLTDLGRWERVDNTPLETRPDGYATGLIVLALEEAVDAAPTRDPAAEGHIRRGIAWLKANQDKTTGAWPAWSLNKKRGPASNAALFMSDAATSYAVMALEGWPAHVDYRSARYGVCVALPGSWKGYSLMTEQWHGFPVGDGAKGDPISGPLLRLRNPAWSEAERHEDLPIMVFTRAQWELAEKNGYGFGAAPVGPSEIGRNARYVFALPPRYNYDLSMGWQDVDDLIREHAVNARCMPPAKMQMASARR